MAPNGEWLTDVGLQVILKHSIGPVQCRRAIDAVLSFLEWPSGRRSDPPRRRVASWSAIVETRSARFLTENFFAAVAAVRADEDCGEILRFDLRRSFTIKDIHPSALKVSAIARRNWRVLRERTGWSKGATFGPRLFSVEAAGGGKLLGLADFAPACAPAGRGLAKLLCVDADPGGDPLAAALLAAIAGRDRRGKIYVASESKARSAQLRRLGLAPTLFARFRGDYDASELTWRHPAAPRPETPDSTHEPRDDRSDSARREVWE
jgi:hypothetical protein